MLSHFFDLIDIKNIKAKDTEDKVQSPVGSGPKITDLDGEEDGESDLTSNQSNFSPS